MGRHDPISCRTLSDCADTDRAMLRRRPFGHQLGRAACRVRVQPVAYWAGLQPYRCGIRVRREAYTTIDFLESRLGRLGVVRACGVHSLFQSRFQPTTDSSVRPWAADKTRCSVIGVTLHSNLTTSGPSSSDERHRANPAPRNRRWLQAAEA